MPTLPVPGCEVFAGTGRIGLRCRPPFTPAGRAVTHVQVDVRQAGGLVASRVVAVPESNYAFVDGLTNGVPYDVSVRYGSFGRLSEPLERRLTPHPVATLQVGTAKEEVGARLPFAVVLDSTSTAPTTVLIAKDPRTAALLGEGPTSVTVPAGELVASGSYEVVPNGVRDESFLLADLDWSATSAPPQPWDYVHGFLHGDAQPDVPTATLSGPATVDEGARGVEYTVTLDRPAATDLQLWVSLGGEQGPTESDEYPVRIPAGRTSATVSVDLGPQNEVAGGDRLLLLGLEGRDPERVDIAPEPLTVRLTDDDASGPALTLDGDLKPRAALRAGVAVSSFVQWQNLGDRAATGARLDLAISDSAPQVTLTPPTGVDCTVTATGGGKGRAISCDLGDVGPGGSGGLMLTWVPTLVPAADVAVTARLDAAAGPEPAGLAATVPVSGPSCTVVGLLGPAVLRGTPGDDVLCGPLSGIPTDDKVQPGAGDDVIRASGKYDYSSAPSAVQSVTTGTDVTVTGWGTDVIETSLPGLEGRVVGSRFGDRLEAGRLDVDGGPGDDTLVWRPLWDGRRVTVVGGTGVDTLIFADGSAASLNLAKSTWFKGIEQVRGTSKRDTLTVGVGITRLDGAGGPDTLVATDGVAGDVTVVGGDGKDTCTVDAGDTVIGCETVTYVPLP